MTAQIGTLHVEVTGKGRTVTVRTWLPALPGGGLTGTGSPDEARALARLLERQADAADGPKER